MVWWINAIALANWLGINQGTKMSNVEICIKAFQALARTSYLNARNDAIAEETGETK